MSRYFSCLSEFMKSHSSQLLCIGNNMGRGSRGQDGLAKLALDQVSIGMRDNNAR
jgi:hypothetical protein